MAGGRLIWPLIEPVLNAIGQVVNGATLTVYQNRTTTPAEIYADMALTTPILNPQTSNSAGRFFAQTKAIWADDSALYTLRVFRPDGSFDVIDDISPQSADAANASENILSVTTIYGLVLSNSQTNPNTHISVSIGHCRDHNDGVNLFLNSAMTKRLDLTWSSGSGGGGRLSGTFAANQTWHAFIMERLDGTSDIGFDSSPTAPILPNGYVYFRRLGAVLTDAAGALRQFIQTGDWFKLKTRTTDYAVQANAGGPFLRKLGLTSPSVPDGIKVEAELYFQTSGTADTNAYLSGVFDPDFGAPPAFGGATQWAQVRRLAVTGPSGTFSYGTVIVRQFTDANRNVYTFSNDPADTIALGVLGWRDERRPV